ncbi:MAG: hypothetical protein KDD70_01185 [Bdellovibrionales bacterium]|nr:hypothetical protein [Bdellovibrionales bacterium]
MTKTLGALLFFGFISSWSLGQLHEFHSQKDEHEKVREVLYLPNGTALSVLSFGYQNVLADVLWFKTVSYFGKHYRGDKDYTWLKHMCTLITDLNPRAEEVFAFCGTMLSWEVEDPRGAHDLFTKAIHYNPQYWRYYYLRGFISMYFLENQQAAEEDFARAATLTDAPVFLARLAASKMSLSDPVAAVAFLTNMLETTEDPNQRAALADKLKQAKRKLWLQQQKANDSTESST